MRRLAGPVAVLLLAVGADAQSPAQLKQELKTKETAAKQDPDALYQVAKWADDKGLAADAKRIYQAALKIKPDHEGANKGLGNELVDGKWMAAKEAAAARKKALDDQYKAKGMIDAGGVWIVKEEADDAKKGIYHHEGWLVTKEELKALQSGMVRHPITGQLIEAKRLEDAKSRHFPVGEGRWVSEKDADAYHADATKPWLLRTEYTSLVSSLPIAKLEELRAIADRGVECVRKLLDSQVPHPNHRPLILIAATTDEFTTYGTKFGDETSAFGAFLAAEQTRAKIENQGEVRLAVCNFIESWGPYYLRHAAGLAYISGLALDAGAELPLWFEHAVGGYASRFDDDKVHGFSEQHLQKGGVKDLKAWFNSFALNGTMEAKELDYNVYQAGLMLSFAADGGDAQAKEALHEVSTALAAGKGKAVDKAIDKLKGVLIAKEEAIRAYFQKLVKS
jgi:hypothetical protein